MDNPCFLHDNSPPLFPHLGGGARSGRSHTAPTTLRQDPRTRPLPAIPIVDLTNYTDRDGYSISSTDIDNFHRPRTSTSSDIRSQSIGLSHSLILRTEVPPCLQSKNSPRRVRSGTLRRSLQLKRYKSPHTDSPIYSVPIKTVPYEQYERGSSPWHFGGRSAIQENDHTSKSRNTSSRPTLAWALFLGTVLVILGGGLLYIYLDPEKVQHLRKMISYYNNITNSYNDDTLTLTDPPVCNETEYQTGNYTHHPVIVINENYVVNSTRNHSKTANNTEEYDRYTTSRHETSVKSKNESIRHCWQCEDHEVCVAMPSDSTPFCRDPEDVTDPTGCGGLCALYTEACQSLDRRLQAYRCRPLEILPPCLDDEWRCNNQLCVPNEKRCDGHLNCYDHSDEYACACDLSTHFHCGNETSCLPNHKRCDRTVDCWDATDELSCAIACPPGQFACTAAEQCVLRTRFCDGLPDCSDNSDEPRGCEGACRGHEARCDNGRCIPKSALCDGNDDCGDYSDEANCPMAKLNPVRP